MNGQAGETPEFSLDRIDRLVCLYLILPTLLFCLWFVPPVAIPLGILGCYGTYRVLKGNRGDRALLSWPFVLAIVALSLGWTALAGVGHFYYANSDWLVRDAVLQDLSRSTAPATYVSNDSSLLILRAAIGYFLPAAAIGHVFGVDTGQITLYLWTALGWGLVLAAAARTFTGRAQQATCLVVLTLFGGMDLLGYVWGHRQLPSIGEHVEWWMSNIQYSSNTTLLFWVPNHALPAWLGTLLVLRHWRRPQLVRIAPLLCTAIPLWSPLAAIGLFPFFLFGISWRRDIRAVFSPRTSLPFAPVALATVLYLGMDADSIPHGWLARLLPSVGEFVYDYVLFCLLEFGILALVLARLRSFDAPLRVAVAVLCLLPFYYYGAANDLAMRASIPSLLVLALATIRPLTQAALPAWRLLLVLVLAIGAIGAAQEPLRALDLRAWKPGARTLPEATASWTGGLGRSFPTHYFAHTGPGGIYRLMRKSPPIEPRKRNNPVESPQ